MNHAGVKSSIDSSRMFNEPYAEIPSGALGTWGCPGFFGGRVHLSPSPSICLTDSFVSLCLPLFGPGCLPAWTPVTALWGGGVHLSSFVSLHLSPVVSQPGCLARLSGWTGSFVTLCLPSFVSRCLPAWMPVTALWVDGFICLPLSPFICLARLSGLCFPSFVSRCLPAWMSGTALQADRFTCLPLSPFICLPLSPSLDAWHGSLGGQFHLSPFVSLHLAPLVSQHLSPISVGGRIELSPFVSLYLSPVVSQPAWMPLWVDGFICLPLSPFVCLPLSPSLDAPLGGRIHLSPVVSQPGCVALTLRGFLHFPRFCPFGGVWFAFGFGPGFGHSLSCGCWGQGPLSALHLDFDFAWARGGSSSLSIVGYTLSVRSVPGYQLRPLSVLARIWSPELTRAVRCGARLQLREGSVNPPVKQT